MAKSSKTFSNKNFFLLDLNNKGTQGIIECIQAEDFNTIIYRTNTEEDTPQVNPQITPQVTPQVEQRIIAIITDLPRNELQKKLRLHSEVQRVILI
jgi:hypothetical protein